MWCWDEKGDFLGRFSLMLVEGNMFVVVGHVSLELWFDVDFWISWSCWRRRGCWCGGGGLKCGVECGRWWCRR